jgi:hypothetical protein
LKQAFRNFAGAIPVEVQFYSQHKKLSSLYIEQTWGVNGSKDIEKQIKTIPSLRSLKWNE